MNKIQGKFNIATWKQVRILLHIFSATQYFPEEIHRQNVKDCACLLPEIIPFALWQYSLRIVASIHSDFAFMPYLH